MKQTSKFLSVILAVVFVLQIFGLVCFAEAVNDLPAEFGWNSEKMGYYQFTVPDHIKDVRYEYGIILYKDGIQVYDTKSSVHPTVYAEERTQSMSYLLDRFAQYGSGDYTFAITVNGETTAQSEPFTYVEPEETLPVPQNVVLLDTQVRWTPVTAENCSGYFVNYYVGYPDGRVDFIYGQQQKKASSDYQDYTLDDDVPKYFNQQVDLLYNLDPVKYPKESAFLMAAVKASSGDIFTVKSSEFSVPVAKNDGTQAITYYADGEVFENVMAEAGAPVPPLNRRPVKEGKLFAGWDAPVPEVMPASDLSFYAVFVSDSSSGLEYLLTEEEVANNYLVVPTVCVSTPSEAISSKFASDYSQYEVAMTVDITLNKGREAEPLERIPQTDSLIPFEFEIPESLMDKGDYVMLREHNGVVEAITQTPNANGEYLQVFDRWLTLYVNRFSLYTLVTKDLVASDATVVLTIGQTQANVNGEAVTNDAAPIIVNDRTMLPIRFVAEQFGATVGWINDTRSVTVTLGDTLISMVIGESVATVNGEVKELDSPSFIENDRTYLPVRFVVENLGLSISWNGETQQVTITR